MDWRAVRRSSAWTRPCDRKKRSRSWQIRTVSVQSVAAILVLLAFSGSYITALAAVAWQVQHAAMSWSLLVLLQLTVLMCLLSICASETNSLHDSRCFLLFCQVPTSSRRCCCSKASCSEAVVASFCSQVPFRLHHAHATAPLVEKISVLADLPYIHT